MTSAEAFAEADRIFAERIAASEQEMREHGIGEDTIASITARLEAEYVEQRRAVASWMNRRGETAH